MHSPATKKLQTSFFTCATALLLSALPATASADGLIVFQGEIVDHTCLVNGSDRRYGRQVNMPPSDDRASDSTAPGATVFTMRLSECPLSLTAPTAAHFEHGSATASEMNNLVAYTRSNTTSIPAIDMPPLNSEHARHVQIRISHLDLSPVMLGRPLAQRRTSRLLLQPTATGDTREGMQSYIASYIRTSNFSLHDAEPLISFLRYSIAYP